MKAAIYVRLSEEDRDKKSPENDSISIQNQKSMLLRFVLEQGWELSSIYADDDYRGADRSRPEWKRLLEDAEAKKFSVIVCKSQSRFTRKMEMVEKYIHGLFPVWGIRFIGTVDNADTDNRGNKKSRQINGLVNEWYLEDLSDSIKAALTTRREQGLHIGAFAIYGYKKDPENKGKLLIDEEAAEIVREVFTLFASGTGKSAICQILNDRGVPNPSRYKHLKGIRHKTPASKRGELWQYFRIVDMLKDEKYIGNMVQGKWGSLSYKTGKNVARPKDKWIRVENTHTPIIDRELWDRVQELLKARAKPFITGKIGVFAGKGKCMYCGATMRTGINRGKRHLMCNTRHISKGACPGSFAYTTELEQAVLGELNSLLDENLDGEVVARGVRLLDNFDERISKLQVGKSAYSKKISDYAKVLKDAYMDKSKGIITDEQFFEFSRDFSKDKERLEALVNDTEAQIATLELKRTKAHDRRQIVEAYSKVDTLERIMVEKLIDHIRVGRRDAITKQLPIEIHWNF